MGLERVRVVILADDYAGYEVRGLLAQHGFSAYIEVVDDRGMVHRVLFDAGQYGEAVVHNARLLNIPLEDVDVVALSHSHYDHSGGLLTIASLFKKRVPLVAHPDIVKPAIYVSDHRTRLDIGIPYSLSALEEKNMVPYLLKSPLEIAPHTYFLGEIPLRETEFTSHIPGVYTIEDGELVPHGFRDDTAVAVELDDEVVVIAGCSHSGIVNIVMHAENLLKKKVKAVVGGLHLVEMPRNKVSRVLDYLEKLGVEELYVGHCTGLLAEAMALEKYGEKFTKIHTGYTLELMP